MTDKSTSESNDSGYDVEEGLRLVKAFRQIDNPLHRQTLLEFAEQLAGRSEDRSY
jgi:hypothetical protein